MNGVGRWQRLSDVMCLASAERCIWTSSVQHRLTPSLNAISGPTEAQPRHASTDWLDSLRNNYLTSNDERESKGSGPSSGGAISIGMEPQSDLIVVHLVEGLRAQRITSSWTGEPLEWVQSRASEYTC